MDRDVMDRIERIERAFRAWRFIGLAASTALLALLCMSWGRAREPQDVLRIKGLIVEDAAGRPRILIGAPVPAVPERKRQDPASGLVLLGETGFDRLQIGGVGGPQMGGVVQKRVAEATGLMVCDEEGDERAGFGHFANGQVGWGLDYEGGEAIVAAVLPDQGLAGIMLNAEVDQGNPTRIMLSTQRGEGASLRLCDDQGTERAALEIGGLGAPALRVLDEKGELVRDALAPR